MSNEDNDRTFEQKSQLDHVKIRPNTYIGSVALHTIPMYVLAENEGEEESIQFILQDLEFSPGLLKIFDEILVNASDHHINYPNKVKNIYIYFDIETGYIAVENDGPGISVVKVNTLHDGEIYKPQAIFSQFLAGDNFNDDTDRIVGGCNGLGGKLANAFSDVFEITTYDETRKLLYTQKFSNRLENIEEPKIVNEKNTGHTIVKFLPNYKSLGYKKYNKTVGKSVNKLIEARAYQTSLYLGLNCSIWFNEEKLEFDKDAGELIKQYADMFLENEFGAYTFTLEHKSNKKLNMEVCIGVSNDNKLKHVSIINGISVYEGGTHIKYICNAIVNYMMPKLEAKLSKTKVSIHQNIILNNLFIFVKCAIVNPEFTSQSKTKLVTAIESFEELKFKDKDLKKLWEFLEQHLMSSALGKLKSVSKTRVTRGHILVKDGHDAKFAGDKKRAKDCSLIICEGKSASGLVDSGINHKKTTLDSDYFGVYSIQGVCPNARKEVEVYVDVKTKTTELIRNDKLKDNVRFTTIVKLLGLDYNKKYDNEEELKTLRYGKVIVATDADVDGRGQIFGLVLNFFDLFWPELVKNGYVTRFNTPMIRAYPKNIKKLVKEFYALHEFETWVQEKYGGDDEKISKDYNIHYYKGLASNKTREIVPMFNNFDKKLCVYEHDEKAYKTLEIYFGKDTNLRKKELVMPVNKDDIIKCSSNKIAITDFLKTDVKEFQRDNIIRKLPHIYDGLVQSRRKVLATARINKKMGHEQIKVVNFCGEIMSNMGYQHGDASLSKTIINMTHSFVGAKNLPLLIGVGQLGTRRHGGKDAGSPRYVSVKLNKKLTDVLYPLQDDFLLPYVFEEGSRVEPEYYLPIVPMSILENTHIPATGWAVKIWARNFDAVLRNIRRVISGEYKKCKKLNIWLRNNNSDIRVSNDKIYMVGKYTYDEKNNTVIITELPLGVYNNDDKYINAVAKNKDGNLIPEIKFCVDKSCYDETTNNDQVDIRFELNPGAMETIKKKYDDALKAGKAIMQPQEIDKPSIKKKKSTTKKSKKDDEPNSDKENNDIDIADDNSVVESVITNPIESYVVDPLFDHIEEFFKLRLVINDNINMIGENKEVAEIKYYSDVFSIWFKARKNLYKERITREVVLIKLYIKYLENIIRFSKERDELQITNNTKEDKFIEILNKNNFVRFNKTMLLNPKYCKISDLEHEILEAEKASYNYIIDLTYRSLLKEACDEREKELQKKKNELQELEKDCLEDENNFIGQKTWLNELDILEKIVHDGCKHGWESSSESKYKFE